MTSRAYYVEKGVLDGKKKKFKWKKGSKQQVTGQFKVKRWTSVSKQQRTGKRRQTQDRKATLLAAGPDLSQCVLDY